MERFLLLMLKITSLLFFFFLSLSLSHIHVSLAKTETANPLTAKASAIRYWNRHIITTRTLPDSPPDFLISKMSPLSAVEAAFFSRLVEEQALSSYLPAFCSSANLFCSFDDTSSEKATSSGKKSPNANFAVYSNKKFSNYGSSRLGGADAFKNYSDGVNFASHSFTRYSQGSTGHDEKFTSYANDGNVAASNFTSYATEATGGSGDFTNYHPRVNVPDLKFASYDSGANNHTLGFTSYTDDTNSGTEVFMSYGKNGNGTPVDFSRYGDTSNVVGSTFNGYGQLGNAANDTFTAYTSNSNNPTNNFKNYGSGGNSATDTFMSYRDGANAGRDSFKSYAKNANSAKANFVNYGKTFSGGTDTFKEYGKGSKGHSVEFKSYSINNTFKDYAKKGVTFAQYTKGSPPNVAALKASGISIIKTVEEGKFFREDVLKQGTVMKMPDIRDKMPKRSFLPRGILSKLPFSTTGIENLKRIFTVKDNSATERVIINALSECERAPSKGETKRCVGSIEDMINFATSVLGQNIVTMTTKNTNGSKENVMIGEVTGINGGNVTKSVSCHQSLYPYLLYYCHSVPKVRVYMADILDVETKVKINQGVAICHLDTSAWSPRHGAFVALGSEPGLIEVCHWIFENDMTWTTKD